MSVETILSDTDSRMDASVDDAKKKLARVRTGRASLSVLDGVVVDYYGTPTPLNQVAKLSIPDPTLIVAQPFDPSTLPVIEKAIIASDLGLNPSNDGKVVRIPIPPLTEERRKDLVKVVKNMAEEGRIAVRNARRSGRQDLDQLGKDGDASDDDVVRAEKQLDALTHQSEASINEVECKSCRI